MTDVAKDSIVKDVSTDLNDFFTAAEDQNPGKADVKVEVPVPAPAPEEQSEHQYDEEIPSLRGDDFPSSYVSMAERIQWQYKMLPKIDYDAIYQEVGELSIKSCPTPTLQVLNDEIQKVQGAKDRLAEIFMAVVQCYNFKKRVVDILQDAWGKFTLEKNSDGRKGDAVFRLSNFNIDFAKNEALFKALSHILRNLDSLHDSLSRRITIYQLTMKLHDVGRSALPDSDFERYSASDSENSMDALLADKVNGDLFGDDDQSNK